MNLALPSQRAILGMLLKPVTWRTSKDVLSHSGSVSLWTDGSGWGGHIVQYVSVSLQAELNARHACLRGHISQKCPSRFPISDLGLIVDAKIPGWISHDSSLFRNDVEIPNFSATFLETS